jgi:hypothetical protein
MNVTREVIHDLWPLYAADEASADTRALVEEFLRQDAEFADLLRGQGEESLLRNEVPKLSPDREAQALRRTKRLLHGRDWFLFFAIMFSCFAFGRIVSDTSWDVSPANFIATATIAGLFWIAFFTRLLWVRKRTYGGQAKDFDRKPQRHRN